MSLSRRASRRYKLSSSYLAAHGLQMRPPGEPRWYHPPSKPYTDMQLEDWEFHFIFKCQEECPHPDREQLYLWSLDLVEEKLRMLQLARMENQDLLFEWHGYYYAHLKRLFPQSRSHKKSNSHPGESFESSEATFAASTEDGYGISSPGTSVGDNVNTSVKSDFLSTATPPYHNSSPFAVQLSFSGRNEIGGSNMSVEHYDYLNEYDPDVIYGATLLSNLKYHFGTDCN